MSFLLAGIMDPQISFSLMPTLETAFSVALRKWQAAIHII